MTSTATIETTMSYSDTAPLTLRCSSTDELRPLAEAVAEVLAPNDVLLLAGGLGAGKTTLAQMLAKAMGVGDDQYVSSPTFALVHEHRGRLPFYHMDLYRLTGEEGVELAGLLDYFDLPGVCVVEWPDRMGSLIPAERLEITLIPETDAGLTRIVVLVPHGHSWCLRLNRIASRLGLTTIVHP